MKKFIFGFLGLGFIAVAGYFLYLSIKLQPIVRHPAAAIIARSVVPLPCSAVKAIDLGYATVSLPAEFANTLVQLDDSLYLSLGGAGSSKISFCPPRSSSEPEVRALLRDISELSGQRIQTWFDLQKM